MFNRWKKRKHAKTSSVSVVSPSSTLTGEAGRPPILRRTATPMIALHDMLSLEQASAPAPAQTPTPASKLSLSSFLDKENTKAVSNLVMLAWEASSHDAVCRASAPDPEEGTIASEIGQQKEVPYNEPPTPSSSWSMAQTKHPPQSRQTRSRIPGAGQDITCHICLSDGSETRIPRRRARVTNRCPADRTVCKSCLQRYIAECISDQNYNNIRCLCVEDSSPETGRVNCRATLSHRHIKRYASPETFQRYDEGVLRLQLERNHNFVWCARPGCGSGQLHDDGEDRPLVRCHVCDFETCFVHRCEWHDGQTCDEYNLELMIGGEQVQLKQNEQIKTCPSCRQGVEKNGGCDHMTCRCNHEFCWLCLAPYQGATGIHTLGRSGHAISCSKYAASTTNGRISRIHQWG